MEKVSCNTSCFFIMIVLTLLFFMQCVDCFAQVPTYEQLKQILNAKSLPLINISVGSEKVSADSFVRGSLELVEYSDKDAITKTEKFQCKIRYRGTSALHQKKKSFAIKLVNQNGEKLEANLCGIRKEDSWILDAMAIDRIRMRNRVCFDVWNEISRTPYNTTLENRNGTNGIFIEVFLNGNYNGLYCLSDKINRKLLGLKKVGLYDGGVEVHGLLYKGINWESGHNLLWYDDADVNVDTWNAWELQYPDDYPSIDTWQPLMDLIDFCSAQTSDETFLQKYNDYFYADNLADYFVFIMALNVGDNVYKNTFLSTPDITKGHRYFLSPWDMDMSLGGLWNGLRNDVLADIHHYDCRAPFNRLWVKNMDGFADMVKEKWSDKRHAVFAPEHIRDLLHAYAERFVASGAWGREYEKWNGTPVPLTQSPLEELEYVENWYMRNYNSLCEKLGGPTEVCSVKASSQTSHFFTIDGRMMQTKSRDLLPSGIYITSEKKMIVIH